MVTRARKKAVSENLESNLTQVLCIHYLINFGKKSVSIFFDSGSEVNAIYPNFAKKLSLTIRPTDVEAQKIDDFKLITYEIVVAAFPMKDKANRVRFFEETFLITNVSLEVVLETLFLTLSGADVDFLVQKL